MSIDNYKPSREEIRARVQLNMEKEEAEARKNYSFLQIEKKALKEIRYLIDRSPVAAKILMIIAEKMNRQNALLCSYETLSTITNLGRTTIYKAIKLLEKESWIQIVKVGSANAYVVNSRVFWQSYGDKKMTVFNATVIASEDEQDKLSKENWKNIKLKYFPLMNRIDITKEIKQKEPENKNE